MPYCLVTVFNLDEPTAVGELNCLAIERHQCLGVEEYSLNEPEVDALLGERSYSGGDLPLEVLLEVETHMLTAQGKHLKFFFAAEADALAFAEVVRGQCLAEVSFEKREDEDWNAEWKKHYRPIRVGEGLLVLPAWEDPTGHSEQTIVRIHPGMGFGTGSHETTFLCLQAFLNRHASYSSESRCLDYGSGSGILGLAFLLAKESTTCDFVDIDPEAHRNCLQNIELNVVDLNRVRMLLTPQRQKLFPSYPLVFANILQGILHEERDFLIDKTAPSGHLILSGLLRPQVEATLSYYTATGAMKLIDHQEKGDWGCLVLERLP